jgi:hypothetical protein
LAHHPGRSAGGLKEAPDQRVGYQGGYFDISKNLAAKKAAQKMMREIKKLHPDVVERLYRPSAAGWRNAKLNDLGNARRCPSEFAGDWMFVLKTMPQGPTRQYDSFDPSAYITSICFAERHCRQWKGLAQITQWTLFAKSPLSSSAARVMDHPECCL